MGIITRILEGTASPGEVLLCGVVVFAALFLGWRSGGKE
jgi:hypothetical protein